MAAVSSADRAGLANYTTSYRDPRGALPEGGGRRGYAVRGGGVGLGVRNCLFLLVQRVGIQECIVDEDRSKQREVLRCHREARLVGPDIFFK